MENHEHLKIQELVEPPSAVITLRSSYSVGAVLPHSVFQHCLTNVWISPLHLHLVKVQNLQFFVRLIQFTYTEPFHSKCCEIYTSFTIRLKNGFK